MRNLEAVEIGLREAVFRDLSAIFEQLLNDASLSVPNNHSAPGEKAHPHRLKEVLTLFGPVRLRQRNYYYSPQKEAGRTPLDEALGIVDGYSPGLLRLMCRAGARQAFEAASADLQAFGGIEVEGRQIPRGVQQLGPLVGQARERLIDLSFWPFMYIAVDATGIPMVAQELKGRKGRQSDGSAKTREVKLASIFTQTTTDSEGLPLRDHASTTYVAGFEKPADWMVRVRHEASRRGSGRTDLLVLMGDGAAWIWQQGKKCFPLAIQILDLYHALEHLMSLAKVLDGEAGAPALWNSWRGKLLGRGGANCWAKK